MIDPHHYQIWASIQRIENTLNKKLSKAQDEIAELKKRLSDWDDLVSESDGVYGYHLNGDLAPWAEFEN